MRTVIWMFVALGGCTYVGDSTYEDDVQDLDGDGLISNRWPGGPDCDDLDATIGRCDADGDGEDSIAVGGTDCDDERADVHPGAPERCDGVDNDCNGRVDDEDTVTLPFGTEWFTDLDGDGFGVGPAVVACEAPAATVAIEGDCDDGDSTSYPGGVELCDPTDHDCDGDPHEGASNAVAYFADDDGDGFGGAFVESACQGPAGAVSNAEDCDDTDASARPAGVPGASTAAEVCDGFDNDCDGLVDAADGDWDASTADTWYPDADGDGFGEDAGAIVACSQPGFILVGGDCDDTTTGVSPVADEVCDGADNDCDGDVDEGAIDLVLLYEDTDGDGFGGTGVLVCGPGPGLVSDDTDCDDTDPATFPGAYEICGDSVRQDCSTFSPFDCDMDGELDVAQGGTDCADGDPDVNSAADEVCDAVDNDCDGLVDDADSDVQPGAVDYYEDADGDGRGSTTLLVAATCSAPPGSSVTSDDCNDAPFDPNAAHTYPGAPERCDGADNDCNGAVDDAPVLDIPTFYLDGDGDGYGDPSAPLSTQCTVPAGYASVDGDCNDADGLAWDGALEVCDGSDNDCDGDLDDADADVSAPAWYFDGDGDGVGQGTAVFACAAPTGHVADFGDCNDADASAVYDGLWFQDGDGDGYGDPGVTSTSCAAPPGFIAPGIDDCDDTEPQASPDGIERCDGIDNDCDGDTDEGPTDGVLHMEDADGDGYGNPLVLVQSCAVPVILGVDCDDGNPGVHSNAVPLRAGPGQEFAHLDDALLMACDGHRIEVAAGTMNFPTTTDLRGLDLTIAAIDPTQPPTFDVAFDDPDGSLFTVVSGQVVRFENIDVVREFDGRAFFADGGVLILDGVRVEGLSARFGTAIRSDGGDVRVSNSDFLSNTSIVDGGAIHALDGVLTVHDSTFHRNVGGAGSVVFGGNQASVSLYDIAVSDVNEATGVRFHTDGELTVRDVEVRGGIGPVWFHRGIDDVHIEGLSALNVDNDGVNAMLFFGGNSVVLPLQIDGIEAGWDEGLPVLELQSAHVMAAHLSLAQADSSHPALKTSTTEGLISDSLMWGAINQLGTGAAMSGTQCGSMACAFPTADMFEVFSPDVHHGLWRLQQRRAGMVTGDRGVGFASAYHSDLDSDGLPDGLELELFWTLAFDGTDDVDSDGLDNASEYAQGTRLDRDDTDLDGVIDGLDTDPLHP